MNDKNLIRNNAKKIRCNLNINEISNKITNNIVNSEIFKCSNNIMIFYPLDNEINLLGLLEYKKNFYLPRMKENNLECCPFNREDELHIKNFGIKEPICESIDSNCLDLILLPALSVDKKGNRLGYGKGFYDRFCKNLYCKKAVVIPDCLLLESIPTENHDIKMDYIITESTIVENL